MGHKKSSNERTKRVAAIAAELIVKGIVDVKELARSHKVSERMIRDDVDKLTSSVIGPAGKSKLRLKSASYHEEARQVHLSLKSDVAYAAVEMLAELPQFRFPSLSISPGTTACLVAAVMVCRNYPAAILTNSMALCDIPLPDAISLTLTGGLYNRGTNSVGGAVTEEGFKKSQRPTQIGILGVSGIGIKGELFVNHSEEYSGLQAMLRSVSELIVVVADQSKLGRGDPWMIGTIPSLVAREEHESGRRNGRRVVLVTNEHSDSLERTMGVTDYRQQLVTLDSLNKLQESLAKLQTGKGEEAPFQIVRAKRNKKALDELREVVPWMRKAKSEGDE